MAKRWYLCDVIGDGSDDNEFRPSVADIPGVNYSAVIPAHPVPGSTALVIVAARNHATIRARSDVDDLPDVALDIRVQAIQKQAADRMNEAASRRGLNVTWSGPDGFRDALRSLGRQCGGDPNFDENAMDVRDV